MANVVIISIYGIYLLSIATILMFVTCIRYFELARKKENPNEKAIVNSFAFFFVFLAIYLILISISFLVLETTYKNQIFWGTFENPSYTYIWLTKSAIISFFVATIIYFYTYENLIKKKAHLATIFCILSIILTIFLSYEIIFYQLFHILFAIIGIYLLHSFFTLMKWSQRELRASTSFILLGNYLMGLFIGYMSPAYLRLGVTPIMLFPALMIVGISLCIFPTIFKPEFFTRDIKYWYLFSTSLIGITLISLIYTLVESDNIIYLISPLLSFLFWTIECIFLLRFLKNEENVNLKGGIAISGIFTKPKRITEEEVSIAKEKLICLVCKNKLARSIFICPDCNTFYCEKCVRIFSDLENMCWVCRTPFDESKPIKPSLIKEKEVRVEEKSTHKKD